MIYVNGDSYACVSDGKRYSEFVGEHYGCESINAAISGSCNARILRTSLRDLIELKKEHNKITAIISLSFILRTELWNKDPKRQDRWKQSGDGEFVSIQFANTMDWHEQPDNALMRYESRVSSYGKSWLTWFDVEAETTNLLQQILLFVTWCEQNDIKYVIFTGPLQEPINMDAPFVKSFNDEVNSNNSIIDIFSSSFTEWCNNKGHQPIDNYTMMIHGKSYICGHHGEAAHRDWANYLIENYL